MSTLLRAAKRVDTSTPTSSLSYDARVTAARAPWAARNPPGAAWVIPRSQTAQRGAPTTQ